MSSFAPRSRWPSRALGSCGGAGHELARPLAHQSRGEGVLGQGRAAAPRRCPRLRPWWRRRTRSRPPPSPRTRRRTTHGPSTSMDDARDADRLRAALSAARHRVSSARAGVLGAERSRPGDRLPAPRYARARERRQAGTRLRSRVARAEQRRLRVRRPRLQLRPHAAELRAVAVAGRADRRAAVRYAKNNARAVLQYWRVPTKDEERSATALLASAPEELLRLAETNTSDATAATELKLPGVRAHADGAGLLRQRRSHRARRRTHVRAHGARRVRRRRRADRGQGAGRARRRARRRDRFAARDRAARRRQAARARRRERRAAAAGTALPRFAAVPLASARRSSRSQLSRDAQR